MNFLHKYLFVIPIVSILCSIWLGLFSLPIFLISMIFIRKKEPVLFYVLGIVTVIYLIPHYLGKVSITDQLIATLVVLGTLFIKKNKAG